MLKRLPWHILAGLLSIGLLGGCTSQPPAPKAADKGPAATSAPATAATAVPAAQASPPAAQTTASPAAATKAAASPTVAAPTSRGEPRGRIVYVFHTSLSPAWLDPQENPALITPYCFQYALHDALVKHMPGQVFAPSLAESYEIAPDFKSATFKLRDGIKFHNGDPVTPEDVKFSYEKYRGANAKILKDKLDRIESPDARTVKFVFKEPFQDFLVLYGSPASGAGWIVPKQYYEQVGPDGFKQKPIGAGPYKFVQQVTGNEFEFEAYTDYWRKTPNVKTLTFRGIAEEATRVAQLQTGEADFINFVPGQLLDVIRNDPNLQLAPLRGGNFWLEFTGFEKPDSPFHNIKVRQAVGLALDREAISAAEDGGLAALTGNWVPEDWPGALKAPAQEYNPARAKQLMAEAGFPNGFDLEALTPLPPFFSIGERVVTAMREIGIRTKLNQMERGAFFAKLTEGPDAFPKGVILHASGAPGDAASRIRNFAICKGVNSRTCLPEIEEKFTRYEASANLQEREQLLNEVQQYIIDNYIYVSVYRAAFINAQGPRIANKWDEIIGAIPQYVYVGPYEDVQLKE